MIRARGLRKAFEARNGRLFWVRRQEPKVAVDGIDLDVEPGSITGLLGLNGAGKTTTIKMLATLLHPDAGEITIDGLDVVRDAARVRPLVNLISGGERSLYMRLTARENLWYFGRLYGLGGAELERRIADLLDLVGLPASLDARVETFSKGMRQRLQIARGLVNRPRWLFLDEPTLGLDVPVARHLRRVTRDLATVHGCGILLTSHYMSEVEELCDRLVVIDRGRIVASGSAARLKAEAAGARATRLLVRGAPGSARLAAFLSRLGDPSHVATEASEQGTVVTVHAEPPEVVAAAVGAGLEVLRAEAIEPSLDDVMVALGGSP